MVSHGVPRFAEDFARSCSNGEVPNPSSRNLAVHSSCYLACFDGLNSSVEPRKVVALLVHEHPGPGSVGHVLGKLAFVCGGLILERI